MSHFLLILLSHTGQLGVATLLQCRVQNLSSIDKCILMTELIAITCVAISDACSTMPVVKNSLIPEYYSKSRCVGLCIYRYSWNLSCNVNDKTLIRHRTRGVFATCPATKLL